MILPMFLYEKPGTRLFPWSSKSEDGESSSIDQSVATDFVDEDLYWEDSEESRWWAAVAVGKSTFNEKISLPAFITMISIFIFVSGLLFAIVSVDLTVPIYGWAKKVAFGGLLLAVIVYFVTTKLWKTAMGNRVPNPFSLLPQSTRRTLAQTSFNLTKAFSQLISL